MDVVDREDGELITLAEAKRQCRVDQDITEEDDDFLGWIGEATTYIETFLRQSFAETTYVEYYDSLPDGLHLPVTPVTELPVITYPDTDGVQQTLSDDLYYMKNSTIYRLPDATYPSTDGRPLGVSITWTVTQDIPSGVKNAAKLFVYHRFSDREGQNQTDLDITMSRILALPERMEVLMAISASEMRWRVTLWSPELDQADDGSVLPTYTLGIARWAKVSEKSGGEAYQDRQVQAEKSYEVTILDRPDLTEDWVLSYAGRKLEIDSILRDGIGYQTVMICHDAGPWDPPWHS